MLVAVAMTKRAEATTKRKEGARRRFHRSAMAAAPGRWPRPWGCRPTGWTAARASRTNTSKKTPGYNLIYFSPQNLIGKGEFGSVYSAQVYAIDEKTKACTLKDKKKVVKDYSKGNQISTINQIQKEFQLTNKARHLGVKAPVFHNKHSFFVMNELPGEDFIDLLENRVIENLSRQQKVRLTKELLVKRYFYE